MIMASNETKVNTIVYLLKKSRKKPESLMN